MLTFLLYISNIVDMNTLLMNDAEVFAMRFAALGNPSRLLLLRILLQAGDGGLNVSDIQSRTEMAGSTQFHHLTALVNAGIVQRNRQGKEMIYSVNVQSIREVYQFLVDNCC